MTFLEEVMVTKSSAMLGARAMPGSAVSFQTRQHPIVSTK